MVVIGSGDTSKVVRNSVYCIVDAYMGVFAGLKFVRSIQ